MLLIWIAATCVLSGILLSAGPPIWRGRLSRMPSASEEREDTLEPRRPGRGLELKANWPRLRSLRLG